MVGKLCSCSLACANGFCSPSARNVFSNDRSFTTATAAISLLRCFLPRSFPRRRGVGRGGGSVLWCGRDSRRRGILRLRAGTSSEKRGRAMASRIRACKYTCAAPTDSKWDKMASKFSKLLENVFYMFCQILKFNKSYTKLLEML
jgi:hypothetical protein